MYVLYAVHICIICSTYMYYIHIIHVCIICSTYIKLHTCNTYSTYYVDVIHTCITHMYALYVLDV